MKPVLKAKILKKFMPPNINK